jgi:hypothetical protein
MSYGLANELFSYDYVIGTKPMRGVTRVNRRLGFIMRYARLFSNPMSSRLLYNALVRSNPQWTLRSGPLEQTIVKGWMSLKCGAEDG